VNCITIDVSSERDAFFQTDFEVTKNKKIQEKIRKDNTKWGPNFFKG